MIRRAAILPVLALLLVAAGEPLPPDQATEYTVQAGETLGGIANRTKVPRVLIVEANGLKPPYDVRAGQRLKIPRTRHHTVIKGETGFTIAYNYGVPWREIAVANGLDGEGALKPGRKLLIPTLLDAPKPASAAGNAPAFAWPLAGPVRRGFSSRSLTDHHDGLDIKAPAGVAVRAAAAGKVLFAGKEPQQYGNLVVVDHGNGWHSAYAFLSKVTVTRGEEVNKGERIGLAGSTGRAKGNELHFELRKDNRPVDPATRLPEAP